MVDGLHTLMASLTKGLLQTLFFHIKSLILSGNSKDHKEFHRLELQFELLGSSGILIWRATWYPILTEYSPSLSKCHISSSSFWFLGRGILRITHVSSYIKWRFSFISFHLFSSSIKLATVMSIGNVGGAIGLKVSVLGSQLSLYTRILLPFSTHHLAPFSITCLPHRMLLHKKYGLEPAFASEKKSCYSILPKEPWKPENWETEAVSSLA